MEIDNPEPEIQEMSTQQKVRFIQKGLAVGDPGHISQRKWEQTQVRFIHPELLWTNFAQTFPISEQGRLVTVTAERTIGRKRVRGIVVDMATKDRSATFYAWFGLGAVGVTKNDEIIIDCTKVTTPKGVAQAMLPHNLFLDK